jgi:hypothetical protein
VTEYVATCNASSLDTITARRDGDAVELEAVHNGEHKMETYLSASKARVFARGILALADEIDGGEVAEADGPVKTPTRTPKVGDRVRVVRNVYSSEGDVNVGKVGTLKELDLGDPQAHRVVFDDADDYGWWCAEVALLDEPAEPATTLGHVPVVSLRGDFVTQAKTLLAGVEHTSAADVIHLAQFLADE